MEKGRKRVYLMTYDHGGYILWGDQFEEKIDSAVDWLEKYDKFKIGLDNESFAYDVYAEECPAIIEKINEVLRRFPGRFAIGSSTYGQPLSMFISEESNARQLVYAVRANLRHFGCTPPVYAISEHALHNQIPQLARQAGYIGAVMRTHFMMYGYNPTYDAPYGWWVGDDGTRIPTVPTYDGEGAAFGITTLDNWVLTRWPDRTTHSIEEFADKFEHIEPLLASRIDDIVHRHEGLVQYVQDFDEYRWVLLEELPELYGEPKETFRPSPNEFRVRMPWGYCANEIFNECSAAERDVTLAERANAAAFLLGGPSMQSMLETAWRNLLVAQHHDVQICGLLSDSRKYLPASRAASKAVTEASMEVLANCMNIQQEKALVVMNAHSFDVSDRVEVEVHRRGSRGFRVTLGGEEVPCETRILDGNRSGPSRARIAFMADVPAGTLHAYEIHADGDGIPARGTYGYDAQTGTLTTPLYECVLDEYGLKRLKDRENQALYIDSARGALFRGVIEDEEAESKGMWSVSLGTNSATAIYVGLIGGIPLRFEMRFFADRRRIDCRASFTHNGERIGRIDVEGYVNGFMHESKLRFVLDTRLGGDAIGLRDMPYRIAQTDEPAYIQGNYWAARRGADFGIAYFNRGARGAVAAGAEFSLPLAYANTYVWGTRMLYGEFAHEFAIYPFREMSEVALHKEALAYQYPLLTRETSAHEGAFDARHAVFSTGADAGVILTALYPENGSVILRACEYTGSTERFAPTCTDGDAAETVTIMGMEIGDDHPGQIRPHEIKSVRIHARSEG